MIAFYWWIVNLSKLRPSSPVPHHFHLVFISKLSQVIDPAGQRSFWQSRLWDSFAPIIRTWDKHKRPIVTWVYWLYSLRAISVILVLLRIISIHKKNDHHSFYNSVSDLELMDRIGKDRLHKKKRLQTLRNSGLQNASFFFMIFLSLSCNVINSKLIWIISKIRTL